MRMSPKKKVIHVWSLKFSTRLKLDFKNELDISIDLNLNIDILINILKQDHA